jgi:hypothetical protein
VRLIYLDQNHWVGLARVANGKDPDPARVATLELVRTLAAQGFARFPLSVGHYLETGSRRVGGSRNRLGTVMTEISQLWTLAPYDKIVDHELEVALALELPNRIEVQPFELLGRGVGHAFAEDAQIRISPSIRSGLPATVVREAEAAVQRVFEVTLLAGPRSAADAAPNRFDGRLFGERFASGLIEFRRRYLSISDLDLRRRFIRYVSVMDILDEVNAVLRANGVDGRDFLAEDVGPLDRLLERMPTRRLDIHLRTEFARDPNLTITANDLIDWAQVGVAAMYCDVVVTDSKIASLLNRPGLVTRATVISSLTELAAA